LNAGRVTEATRNEPNDEEQFATWDRIWREFQQDLAKRSTHGELRVAEKEWTLIQRDQSEFVIKRFET